MTTLDELRAKSNPPRRCSMQKFIDELTGQDHETATAAMHDREISNSVLHSWLRTLGFKMATDTMEKHRCRRCTCE